MKQNEKFELMSALMDGMLDSEDDSRRAVDLLLNDADCQKKWEEYHVIGMSLRNLMSKNAVQDSPLKVVFRNQSRHNTHKIFRVGLSLAATVSALVIGGTVFWPKNYSFTPDNNVMMSSLATGNLEIAMLTFMSDKMIDDVEYAKQQRSLDNTFLRTHGNSGNTGGIIRVAFPKH